MKFRIRELLNKNCYNLSKKLIILVSSAALHVSCTGTHLNLKDKEIMTETFIVKDILIQSSIMKIRSGSIKSSDILSHLKLGGFSGLHFKGLNEKKDHYNFLTLTDRGPNLDQIHEKDQLLRPFVDSQFQPRIVELSLPIATQFNFSIEPVAQYPLFWKDGSKARGVPQNQERDEIPLNVSGKKISFDPKGIDPESLSQDSDGNYWVGEEYGPSILKLNSNFQILERLNPGEELPSYYMKRQINRGFEGIAVQGSKVYAFIQSPLKPHSQVMRILEYDYKVKKCTAEYLYFLDNPEVDKLGDATFLSNNNFLIIEQNTKIGKESIHHIKKINIENATNVLGRTEDFESMEATFFSKNNIRLALKTEFIDLVKIGIRDFDKIEGLAIIDDFTLAIIADNDFGVGDLNIKEMSQWDHQNIINKQNSHLFIIKQNKSFLTN